MICEEEKFKIYKVFKDGMKEVYKSFNYVGVVIGVIVNVVLFCVYLCFICIFSKVIRF